MPDNAPGLPPLRERLLLVDNRIEDLHALRHALAPLGGELITATSGLEALSLLERRSVGAVLMNAHLPDLDAMETTARLRAQATTRTIPILLLTGPEHGLDRQLHGYAVGAVDYLATSLEPEVLRAKVRSIVSWAAELRALARTEVADAACGPDAFAPRGGVALSSRSDRNAEAHTDGRVLSLVGATRSAADFVGLERLLELQLDASLEAPAVARAAFQRALAASATERQVQTATLLVSELVTNAVLHARSPSVLRCDLGPTVLRVEVHDATPRAPVPERNAASGAGRGLKMLRALAARSGWTSHARGKAVWFELDLDPSS